MNKNQVIHLLKTLLKEELIEDAYLLAFKDTEAPTNKAELIVQLAGGKEFQITLDRCTISVKRRGTVCPPRRARNAPVVPATQHREPQH